MADAPVVLLARHGETDDNAAGRFQGHRNPTLNDRGREQARALGESLLGEGVVALYASPLNRAAETARIAGEVLGLEPRFDPRLAEVDVGDWSGLSYREVLERHPGAFDRWRTGDPVFRFPGGESLREQAERVAAALQDIKTGPTPALVVTHGGSIRAALRTVLGPDAEGEVVQNGSWHRL